MESISLVRARYASSFVVALQPHGAPIEDYLLQANLPVELLEHGDGLISAQSLWHFAEIAAHSTGIFDLGFWAGSTPIEVHGDFGTNVVHAITLHSAISTFCSEARAEYSKADFYLTRRGLTSWFCRGPIEGTPEQQQQVELYVVVLMLQTIQLFLGSDWRPEKLRLQSTGESAISDNEMLLNMNIEFGAPVTAIYIPLLSLATAMPSTQNVLFNPVPFSELPSSEPLKTLRDLLAAYMRYIKHPDIRFTADIAGLSTRSLQRFLQSKGTTHTRLIDEVRFDLAVPLLNDEALTITEIAYELGYANVAHFSRAFRRITGMSPRNYRNNSKEYKTRVGPM